MSMTADELLYASELEKTKKMMSALTYPEVQAVQAVIKAFLTNPAAQRPFRPLTEEELIARIDEGLAQAKRGEGMDAEAFETELRREYGFEA